MPIQMCPIEIPLGYEFARHGRCMGGANEPYFERSGGTLRVWDRPDDSVGHYIILRKLPPVPKYIPFTAETFRPHRDRWVRYKKSNNEFRIDAIYSDEKLFAVAINHTLYTLQQAFEQYEFINQDETTEPFGQKVEG